MNEIISFAKSCLENSISYGYPDGYSVSNWWSDIQKKNREVIRGFQSPEEAIRYAQVGSYSGFDHRLTLAAENAKIVNFKLNELKYQFPNFRIEDHPEVNESPLSIDESIVEIKGRKLSNIFLSHLYFFLRTQQLFEGQGLPRKILEIGSGYGALARIYKTMNKGVSYTLLDLPESLFYAHTFLSASFPDAKIKYLNEKTNEDLSGYDFILVPVQNCTFLAEKEFDLVINTGSLQEMPDATVKFWMNFIQNIIRTKFFYSWNYFLNNKEIYSETSLEHVNLVCPILDPYWKVEYFRINEPILTVDAESRNWLEVAVKRIPASERERINPRERAKALFEESSFFRKGTQMWFAKTWMAIWCDPRKEYVESMLEGIDMFVKGKCFGVPNLLDNRNHLYPELGHLIYFSYRVGRSILRNFLSKFSSRFKYEKYDTRNSYSEIKFYQNLLR